jgi:NAD(P)-dependent dehydrogenase (short-subunit alcohol dehydrogenase family)
MPDRAALVTGASSGIGFAIADLLGAEGHALTVAARRPEKLSAAVEQLRAKGYDVEEVAANLTEEEDVQRVVAAHRERYGRLDVLVNSAGVGIGAPLADIQTKRVDMQLDLNLRAIVLFYRECAAATKAAVVGWTQSMNQELANDGIKSVALCPGFVDTPMTEFIREQVKPAEMIQPDDIAEAVRFLLRTSPYCLVPEIVFERPGASL